ncbi:MAG: signal protein PDZ, partial [Deltaproteobacteria bacterium]|nr:signal protein PDZ [Deltaproteobacteria bacterium]
MDSVRRMIIRAARILVLAATVLTLLPAVPALAAPRESSGLASAAAQTQPAGTVLFKEATFLLPRGAKVESRWVLPPTELSKDSILFSVDASGSPILLITGILSYGNPYLVDPAGQYLVALDSEISGMAHLANGVLVMAAGSDLVLPAQPTEKAVDKYGVPYAALQPLTSLPLREIEVLAAAGNSVYCAGVDQQSGRNALYLLRVAKGVGVQDLEMVYQADEPITAVAGSGGIIYVALGKKVVLFFLNDTATTEIYTHPSATVTGLAPLQEGILVSTGKEIVWTGPNGAMEILRSTGHRMALRD